MSIIEHALGKMSGFRERTPDKPAPAPVQASPAADERQAPLAQRRMVLPYAQLRDGGLQGTSESQSVLAYQYRAVKRPVLNKALGRNGPAQQNGRIIVVTSSVPGEGKSFTAFNLTLNLALEPRIKVLLIDGDVAKASLTTTLGLGDERGLLDLLADDRSQPQEFIFSTDVPGFFVMPAGRYRDTATELISSQRMQAVIADLAQKHPSLLVVFDSPPLLLTNEARALVALAGQVLIVVRAGSTPRQLVADSLETVNPELFVGLILNQCDPREADTHYYRPTRQNSDSWESDGSPPATSDSE